MKKKQHHVKKSIALLVVTLVTLVSFPTQSRAFVVVAPATDALVAANTAVGAGNAVSTLGLNVKEYALDPLAYSLSKIALHSLTKSVVGWINSGFKGSPAFVQDLNQTLLSVGDAEANRFIDEFTKSGALQNLPWRDDVAQAVLGSYLRSTSNDSFTLENPDTLSQVSSDPNAFVRGGDFSKGGLDAWMAVVLNPANSPRGLFEVAKNRLNSDIAGAKGNKVTELNWGNGFGAYRGNCPPTQSGYLGGSSLGNGNVLSLNGGAAKPGDGTATGLTLDTYNNKVSGGRSGTANSPTVLSGADPCIGQPILTPSSLITQSANKFLVDAGIDQYVAGDEITEILNALMGQLVGNVLGGGGLLGLSNPKSGGGRSYIDRATDPSGQSTASQSLSLSTAFLGTIAKQAQLLTQYKDAWTTLGGAASSAKAALGGVSCPKVEATLSQAGTAVSVASNALSEIDKIKNQLTADIAQDPTSQQTIVSDATTAYQALQSSGALPSITAINYALTESQDRAADPTNGAVASLYTQMANAAATGVCPL